MWSRKRGDCSPDPFGLQAVTDKPLQKNTTRRRNPCAWISIVSKRGSVYQNVVELIARYEWRRRFPAWRETMDWVQDLRQWFDRKYDKPAREAFCKLIERASQSAQVSRQRVAGTLHRWFEPIVRYIRHRYTNGMTEGFNNKIKLIQRMAYGLRNEHNRRKRILAWCGQP